MNTHTGRLTADRAAGSDGGIRTLARPVDDRPHASANRRIAFGDRTVEPVLAAPDDPPGERWLAAVALGGRGRYGAAWALLAPLVRDPGVPAAIRAHAAVTRASHLRQLGGHLPARRWDGLGLALAGSRSPARPAAGFSLFDAAATETAAAADADPDSADPDAADAAGARVDALLGLAADALGPAEPDLTERLLAAAEPLVAAHLSWRPTVRLSWIRAELALARDRPDAALRYAERGIGGARAAGAVRHQVKSELVALVARSCVGEPVYPALRALCDRSSAAGIHSLEWPMTLLLARFAGPGDARAAAGHRDRYHQLLSTIRRGCDPQGRLVLDRSPWVSALDNP